MWDLLSQQTFIVGATLVLLYQAAKFRELSRTDPVTSRYVALLPGAQVRDFAGPYEYYFGLAGFLAASFLLYFALCHVSPDVLTGFAKILKVEGADKLMEGIPYPLYIAALFVGLTQPIIPGFAQFEEAQRNFFHDRIEVTRRVIDLSESLLSAIDARSGGDKKRLSNEVRKLVGPEFISGLRQYGDLAFYRNQLDEMKLDNGALDDVLSRSSANELRGLIERLVLCALVAVMRRSGPRSLIKVAESLGASKAVPIGGRIRGFLTGLIASSLIFGVGLLIIAHVLSWLYGPVSGFFGKGESSLWPDSLQSVGDEFWGMVPTIAVCVALVVCCLTSRGRLEDRHENDGPLLVDFMNFFQAGASIFGLCFLAAVVIKFGQMFAEYGTLHVPKEALSMSRLILPVIQSLIGVAACVFTAWYLVSSRDGHPRPGLSFVSTILMIAGATGFIAFLYDLTFLDEYLHVHPEAGPGWEHVLFSVLANVLVSICAFASVAVFFKTREVSRKSATAPRRDDSREGTQAVLQ